MNEPDPHPFVPFLSYTHGEPTTHDPETGRAAKALARIGRPTRCGPAARQEPSEEFFGLRCSPPSLGAQERADLEKLNSTVRRGKPTERLTRWPA